MNEIPRIMEYSGYGWFGVLAMMLLLGFFLSLGKAGAHYLNKLSASSKPGQRMVNYSEEIVDAKAGILLAVVTVLSIIFCVVVLLRHYGVITLTLQSVAVAAGVTVLFLALKYLLIIIIDSVFSLSFDAVRIWLFLVYVLFGIACLLLTLYVTYIRAAVQPLIPLAVIIAVALLTEIFVFVKNFSAKPVVVFYIFLYLCAAEILPLAVGLKAVSNVLN